MSQKKVSKPKTVIVNRKNLLAAIQALTIFYEDKSNAFLAIKTEFGDEHPATIAMFEELDTLGNILNFITSLMNEKPEGTESYN